MKSSLIKILFPLTFLFILSSCSNRPQSVKDKDTVRKYQTLIGCDRYNQLKPLPDEFPIIKEKCRVHYSNIDPAKEFINATVFKGMNQHILFVHLTYKSQQRQRDAVNYIYHLDRDTIIGSYRCY